MKFLFETAIRSIYTRLVDFPEFCSQNFPEIDVPFLNMKTRTKVYEMLPLTETPPSLLIYGSLKA